MVEEARRRPEVSMPAEMTVDRVQELGSGHITVTQGDAQTVWNQPFCFDTYDSMLRNPYLFAGRVLTAIDVDNVGLAKESTVTGIRGVLDARLTKCDTDSVKVTTGRVDIANVPLSVTGTIAVETGYVGVRSHYMASVQVVTGLVNPGSIVTGTEHVAIGSYRTKTVVGRCYFDGTLHIDCSPSGTTNYFTDVYTASISSGTTFTASFTEAFDYMVVRIENTSSATGSANVWVVRQV